MKRIWDIVKKFLIWTGAVTAVAVVCTAIFIWKNTAKKADKKDIDVYAIKPSEDREEKIEKEAQAVGEETASNIRNTPAADIAAGHPAVRESINTGIERFRERCGSSGQ